MALSFAYGRERQEIFWVWVEDFSDSEALKFLELKGFGDKKKDFVDACALT